MSVDDISVQGRSATGVRVMTPDEDRHVVALSRVPVSEFDDEE